MISFHLMSAHSGGYLRIRASVFLAKGDRTSGGEGTHQVLPDAGEISRVSVFKFLSDTQTGELPHRLNMRPFGSIGAVRRLAACCLPARGTAVAAPLRPVPTFATTPRFRRDYARLIAAQRERLGQPA
jgi:hypothetical protein